MSRILVVRLGAMGDILHTMPAVERIRRGMPSAELAWVVDPRWIPLLAGTGLVDHLLPLDRRDALSVWIALRWLRRWRPEVSIDFQGLLKSSILGFLSGASRRYGWSAATAREPHSAIFQTDCIDPVAAHVVLRNFELAACLGVPAVESRLTAPAGFPEGQLPDRPFVLAAPFAGWASKQWPLEHYVEIGRRLWREKQMPLVLNIMPAAELPASEFLYRHTSGIEGLIHATRQAAAVLGVDSGPLHLAALLNKPGVALFGPTDPARNGPFGDTIRTLRAPGAETTYKRGDSIVPSMLALHPDQVWQSLIEVLP